MHATKLTSVMVAVVAATTLVHAAAPAEAQTTTVRKQSTPVAGRAPAQVTVYKRSYLDPGTATKRHAEHRLDYAFPPGGNSPYMNPTLFYTGPGLPIMMDRMPFPNCFDLPGFCQ
jgi:hypothetical protein